MRNSSRSSLLKNESTVQTTQRLPLTTSLKQNPKSNRSQTHRSLSDSIVSTKSEAISNRFRLPHSFYNDHSNIYEKRSRMLLQRNRSFQSRPISLSQRRRYESDKVQRIAIKHRQMKSLESSPIDHNQDLNSDTKRQMAKKRFQDVMSNKYKKLIHGSSVIKVGQQILQKSIKRSFSEKPSKKWKSPFSGQTPKDEFKGKQLLPKKVQKIYGNEDPSQLKVLNLDRLFRVKNGKLGNIVPLPVVKLNEVSARSNIVKTVLNRDKIHEVIKEYNSLLRLMKLKQTVPRLGIKGKTFTKTPTIEELMGIKLNPAHSQIYSTDQSLSEEVFINHCKFYQDSIKKDVHITRRLLSGLQQQQAKGLSLVAFTRFYTLFISNIASIEDKSAFLAYFFVPHSQQKIEFDVLKLILQVMCRQLPSIDKLNMKTDLLSKQQKSRIFLQALIRVLFGDIEQDFFQSGGLSRQVLKIIFQNNPDATDLLLRLIQLE